MRSNLQDHLTDVDIREAERLEKDLKTIMALVDIIFLMKNDNDIPS